MYIELTSHSLLQGGPFFFVDFCEIERKKLLTKIFQKTEKVKKNEKNCPKNVERTETLKNNFFLKPLQSFSPVS